MDPGAAADESYRLADSGEVDQFRWQQDATFTVDRDPPGFGDDDGGKVVFLVGEHIELFETVRHALHEGAVTRFQGGTTGRRIDIADPVAFGRQLGTEVRRQGDAPLPVDPVLVCACEQRHWRGFQSIPVTSPGSTRKSPRMGL